MTLDEAKQLIARVPHWHHVFEIYPGLETPGVYNPKFIFDKLRLPPDLKGQRVLDIGPSDGFFSREAHARGADVVCVDYRDKNQSGFGVMEQLYGAVFDYRRLNLYDLPSANLGRFDIIFFLGVLYHLPDMLRGLTIVRALSRGQVYLETHSENDFCPDVAAARYYVGDTLSKDWTNFWAPNRLCMLDMLYDAGFDVVREESWATRMLVQAKVGTDATRDKKMNSAVRRQAAAYSVPANGR